MKIWQSKTGGNLLVRLDRGEEICAAIKAIAVVRKTALAAG